MPEAIEVLRRRLVSTGRDAFIRLRAEFATKEPSVIFHALFPVAVEFTGDGAD